MVQLLKNVATIHNWRRNFTPSDDIHLYHGVYIRYSLDVDNFLNYLQDDSQKHHSELEVIVLDYDLSDIIVDHEHERSGEYRMGEDVWDVENDKFYRAVQDIEYVAPVDEVLGDDPSTAGTTETTFVITPAVDEVYRELTDTTYWEELTPAFRGNDVVQQIIDRVGNNYKIMLRVTRGQYNSSYNGGNTGLLVEVSTPAQGFLYSARNHVIAVGTNNSFNSFVRSNAENTCRLFITDPPNNANDRAGYLLHNFNTR